MNKALERRVEALETRLSPQDEAERKPLADWADLRRRVEAVEGPQEWPQSPPGGFADWEQLLAWVRA